MHMWQGEQLKRRNAQLTGEKVLPPLLASDSENPSLINKSEGPDQSTRDISEQVSLAVSSGKVGGFPTNSSSSSFSEFEMP
ncbi:hypothetical protein B296_00051036, partial [Ensete ventricosum]